MNWKSFALVLISLTAVLAAACVEEPLPGDGQDSSSSLGATPTSSAPGGAETAVGPDASPTAMPSTPSDTPVASLTPAESVPSPAAATTPIPEAVSATDTIAAAVTVARANFRLLISDDRNAIGDFEKLLITIDRVGLQHGGPGGWLELEVPDDRNTVDLVQLQGDSAQEIIRADVPVGRYNKVFIHVDAVVGDLAATSTPSQTTVKLPSSKIQINTPFEVSEGSMTAFVYDITVIAAGNEKRGVKYILKPVISESGASKPFKEEKPARGRDDDNDDEDEDDSDDDMATSTPETIEDDEDDDIATSTPDTIDDDEDHDVATSTAVYIDSRSEPSPHDAPGGSRITPRPEADRFRWLRA